MNEHTTSTDDPQPHVEVGQQLAAARRAARLTQTEVGRRLGVPRSRVAKLETSARRPQYLEAFEYAELYGVGIETFKPR